METILKFQIEDGCGGSNFTLDKAYVGTVEELNEFQSDIMCDLEGHVDTDVEYGLNHMVGEMFYYAGEDKTVKLWVDRKIVENEDIEFVFRIFETINTKD